MLSQLLKAEMAEREVRSISYHMKAARFPAYKDLSGFDFAASKVNEALVRQLHRCEFMDAAENMVLIGGPGTGKSHIATALGVQAIEHHRKRVRFFSTVELVNALEQEKAQGRAGKIAEALVKTELVILDELGYPDILVVDNGPELRGRALDGWANDHGVQLYFIDPGKPTQNADIESFNGRYREECLNQHWFAYSGAFAHPFRQHAPPYSGVSAHL
jgi:transposase InsO family protein